MPLMLENTHPTSYVYFFSFFFSFKKEKKSSRESMQVYHPDVCVEGGGARIGGGGANPGD